MAFQHHLESVFLHPVTLSQCGSFCCGKPLRKVVVYSSVQLIELFVAYRCLYPYGCCSEILRQFNSSTHALDVNSLLVALSASPSCKLDYQAKANDVYFQFAVDTKQCFVALQITSSGITKSMRSINPLLTLSPLPNFPSIFC